MSTIQQLPAIPPITEPLALRSSGDPAAFNEAVERNVQDMHDMGASLNGPWRTAWNDSVEAVNALLGNMASVDAVAQHVDFISSFSSNMPAVTAAPGHAAAAAQSATDAETAKTGAVSAKNDAQTAKAGADMAEAGAAAAKAGAEAARTGAETARIGAETARTGAAMAETGAVAAQTAAEAARDAAQAIVGLDVSTTPVPNAIPQALSTGKLDAGWIPADIDISGNAATATALQTARTISFTGAVTGSVSFAGDSDVNIETEMAQSGGLLPGGTPYTQIYTATTTFRVPSGVKKLLVVCIGAGGNGVYSNAISAAGGTGGAAASVYIDVTPGQEIPVTVGTPTARTSSFGAYLSCSNTVTTSLPIQMQSVAGNGGDSGYKSGTAIYQNMGGGGGGFNPPSWYVFALSGPSSPPTAGTSVQTEYNPSGTMPAVGSSEWNALCVKGGGTGYLSAANGENVHSESYTASGGSTYNVPCAGDGGGFGGGGGSTYRNEAQAIGTGGSGAVAVFW